VDDVDDWSDDELEGLPPLSAAVPTTDAHEGLQVRYDI